MSKCEFCDMTLKSDLDVSKHLVSQTHRDNVRKAIELHPLEKSNLKDSPANIVKVYDSLKLRTIKDVRDLADKGYFKIPDNSPGILSVADRLVHVFLKCIAEHRTRNMTAQSRKIVMDSFDKVKEESPADPSSAQASAQNTTKGTQHRTQAKQVDTRQGERQQASSNQPLTRKEPSATKSPPPKRRLTNDPRPAVYTPNVPTSQTRPTVATQSSNQSNLPQTTRHTGSKNATNPSQAPRPRTAVPVQRPPNAGLIPGQSTTRTPSARPQETRPTAPRLNNPRPDLMAATTATAARPPVARPVNNQSSRSARPQDNLPPPNQMPMAGACFMPPRPMDMEAPPQPRLDSNYRPQLAKIKLEPKDK